MDDRAIAEGSAHRATGTFRSVSDPLAVIGVGGRRGVVGRRTRFLLGDGSAPRDPDPRCIPEWHKTRAPQPTCARRLGRGHGPNWRRPTSPGPRARTVKRKEANLMGGESQVRRNP
jgi:hypothetical protein